MRKFILLIIIGLLLIGGCSKKFRLKRDHWETPSKWPYARYNLKANAHLDQGQFNGKLDIVWEYQSNDRPIGPLTIQHDYLVYPGGRNRLQFLTIKEGKSKGRIKPKGYPQTGLVVKDTLGYFANSPKKSNLKCVNLLNGKTIWEKKVKDALIGSIIVNNKLIIGSSEGVLVARDLYSGDLIWSYKNQERFSSSPILVDDYLYLATDRGTILKLNPEDGSETMKLELKNSTVNSPVYNRYIFFTTVTGDIYAVDPNSSSIVWEKNIGFPIWTSPAIGKSKLYFGHNGGEVVAMNIENGAIEWRFKTTDVIRASVIAINDYVIAGTMSGELYCLNSEDGSPVSQRTLKGAVLTSPVSDGDYVYVATEKGLIACLGDKHDIEN